MAKDIIQVMKGLKKDLPQLLPGQMGFCVDTEEVLIGNGDGNANVPLGAKGDSGNDGITYTPHVSEDGILSWTNDGGEVNPHEVNLKGDKGDKGDQGGKGNTYTPHISDSGVLSWTNNENENNPAPLKIKGILSAIQEVQIYINVSDSASDGIIYEGEAIPFCDIGTFLFLHNTTGVDKERLYVNDEVYYNLSRPLLTGRWGLCRVDKHPITGVDGELGMIEVLGLV